jgi:hypothetical protein
MNEKDSEPIENADAENGDNAGRKRIFAYSLFGLVNYYFYPDKAFVYDFDKDEQQP